MKKQKVLISIFLMVALSLVFIGCDTGSNSTSGGSNGSSNTGTGTGGTGTDGTGTGDPNIWTEVTSLSQITGTWEFVEEAKEGSQIEGAILKQVLTISSDKVEMSSIEDYSKVAGLDEPAIGEGGTVLQQTLWEALTEFDEEDGLIIDNDKRTITFVMVDEVSVNGDKTKWKLSAKNDDGEESEQVFIKAN